MEATVSYRLVDWLQEIEDPFAPNGKRPVIRYAALGQRLSTEASGDDPNVIYGVPERDMERFESLGALHTAEAEDALASGAGDTRVLESTDSVRPVTSDLSSSFDAGVAGAAGPRPVAFDAMTEFALADYFVNQQYDDAEIIGFIEAHPNLADKAATASNLMAAAYAARGVTDLPEEIAQAVADAKGTALRGPEGSEGIEGTEGQGTPLGDDPDSGGDGEGYSPAAKELADEHGIAIADVEGTGADGKVIKADVEKHIQENS